jgi:hypothetical protein
MSSPAQVRPPRQRRHRRAVPGPEERGQRADGQGDGVHHRHHGQAEQQRERDERSEQRAASVHDEEQVAAVPAVGQHAARQAENEVWQQLQHADDAHRHA